MTATEANRSSSGENRLQLIRRFVRIGGNRSITTARVIGLGENHSEQSHPELIGRFIDAFAQEGDVVLLEGVERGKEVFKGRSSTHERFQLPTRVHAIGWDDLALRAEAVRMYKEGALIIDEMREAADAKDYDRFDKVNARRLALEEQREEVSGRKRNLSLLQTLARVRTEFPGRKVFIIAGRNHLTEDAHVTEELERLPYVVLKPDTPEASREEAYKRSRRRILEEL